MRRKSKEQEKQDKISASKARGVIALILLLLLFQTVTFILNRISYRDEDNFSTGSSRQSIDNGGNSSTDVNELSRRQKDYALLRRVKEPFLFDPNTISQDSLELLGFSEKQALTIIHYREKGGRFRKREDFAKMYCVSAEVYKELEPYISIKGESYSKAGAVIKNRYSNGVGKQNSNVDLINQSSGGSDNLNGSNSPALNSSGNNSVLNSSLDSFRKQTSGVLVDINSADSLALVSVRGIGPYYAKQIIKYRERLGGFVSKEQLLEINRMTEERYKPIAEQITVNASGTRKIDFKKLADEKERSFREFLEHHPYVGYHTLKGIELYVRSLSADSLTKVTSEELLNQLLFYQLLSNEMYYKILPYVK